MTTRSNAMIVLVLLFGLLATIVLHLSPKPEVTGSAPMPFVATAVPVPTLSGYGLDGAESVSSLADPGFTLAGPLPQLTGYDLATAQELAQLVRDPGFSLAPESAIRLSILTSQMSEGPLWPADDVRDFENQQLNEAWSQSLAAWNSMDPLYRFIPQAKEELAQLVDDKAKYKFRRRELESQAAEIAATQGENFEQLSDIHTMKIEHSLHLLTYMEYLQRQAIPAAESDMEVFAWGLHRLANQMMQRTNFLEHFQAFLDRWHGKGFDPFPIVFPSG